MRTAMPSRPRIRANERAQRRAPGIRTLRGRARRADHPYAASVTFWPMNHGVAETEDDMKALLQGAGEAGEQTLGLLVPLRSGLFRWCLEEGLRLVKPMNLMALGDYQEPRGGWFPSVLYRTSRDVGRRLRL